MLFYSCRLYPRNVDILNNQAIALWEKYLVHAKLVDNLLALDVAFCEICWKAIQGNCSLVMSVYSVGKGGSREIKNSDWIFDSLPSQIIGVAIYQLLTEFL